MADRSPLIDFLNHGRLPFVGREPELDSLVSFWRGGDDTAAELRLLLLSAEAGQGKTRLLDELAAHVRSQGGCALNARLRPEGTVSVGALIAAALEAQAPLPVRRRDPLSAPTVSQLLPELERLCALRRTVLVLEDLHLADASSLRELALLFDGVREVPLAIVAAMRPLEHPVRDLLAGLAVQELRLHGLSPAALASLWTQLFDITPGADVLAPLVNATHGNALAVRAALRAALRGQYPGVQSGSAPLRINTAAFATVAQRSAHAIALGMTADLDPKLLAAAQRLALLGEVFTLQAAEAMLGEEGGEMIAALVDRGLLAHTQAPGPSLNGTPVVGEPLAFTHTLLHAALAGDAQNDPEILGSLPPAVAQGVSLLSSLPYAVLRDHIDFGVYGREFLDGFFTELHRAARHVLYSIDSHIAPVVIAALDRLNITLEPMLERQEQRLANAIDLRLLHLTHIHNQVMSEEYGLELQRVEAMIAALPIGERMARFAATTMVYRFRRTVVEGGDWQAVNRRFDELIEQYPALRASPRHLRYLADRALAASNSGDYAEIRRLEGIAEELLADEGLSKEQQTEVKMRLWPMTLVLLASREEVEKRKKMMEELDELFAHGLAPNTLQEVMYRSKRAQVVATIGDFERVIPDIERVIPDLRRYGVLGTMHTRSILLDHARRMVHLEPNTVARLHAVLGTIQASEPEGLPIQLERYRLSAADYLRVAALFHCNGALLDAADEIVGRTTTSFSLLLPAAAAFRGDWDLCRTLLLDTQLDRFGMLATDLLNLTFPLSEAAREDLSIRTAGLAPTALMVLDQLTVLFLLERAAAHTEAKEAREQFLADACDLFRRILEWNEEYRLSETLSALLVRFSSLLPQRELRRWRARAEELASATRPAAIAGRTQPLALSLCGEIAYRRNDEPMQRLRGTRNQILLGLLVVQPLLRDPLDRLSFLELASGVECDPDRARVATNIAVLRLREALGEEAVIATGDPPLPALNPDEVRVDLWEAVDAVKRAEGALRRGVLTEAREQLLAALPTLAGRIVLPGLYDELFESMREDLDARLRDAVMTTAAKLLGMEDTAGAAELLHPWLASAPEDEEARELLAEALRRTGHTADAVVVTRAIPQE